MEDIVICINPESFVLGLMAGLALASIIALIVSNWLFNN